jgi:transcriptional regulator with GAF, ATPase, and Fis domain
MSGAGDTTSTAHDFEQRRREIVRRLVLVHGSTRSGQEVVVLDGAPLVLGRDGGDGAIALDDSKVSRRHAVIALDEQGGSFVITDQGSRNGTYVDGVRIDRAALRQGRVIRVGSTLFIYTWAELGDPASIRPEAGPLFGPSLAMARVRDEIYRVAPTGVPVLVLGETGVGKELAAGEIHARSGRKGAFLPVNCAAITESVAEGELFGHEAGAFTGAAQRREGLLAAADGGTLFLDEIGELPLAVQPKLLRALALGEVRPVGSTRPRRVDVRVVAATNRDLAAAERDGTFRGDLLARLSGWTLSIPPLRDRRDDILPLARRFLRGRPGMPGLSALAAEALLLHAFPHNVRELEHELGAALARWTGEGPIGVEHLSAALAVRAGDRADPGALRVTPPDRPEAPAPETPPAPAQPVPPRARPEAAELRAALERFHGNVAQVAAYYGRDRHQVYRWAERLGLDLDSFRG